ncbi:MBL fold metallo-hydrolase [Candidatus Amesbacteria bacterium]|nr:MBL fold metallo-hydrolase [Candidatus Amesbacteria bacterium]
MEITYLGHASFRLKGKTATVVTDPYDEKLAKFPRDVAADIVTVSHDHFDHNAVKSVQGLAFSVQGPGEYEVKGVSIIGVHTWHDDKNGAERGENTVYIMEMDGLRLAHLGDLGHKLSQEQLDEMGPIDVVLVPVGGVYTIDAKMAAEVVKQVDPGVAIPMHYKQLNPELGGVEDFLKEMGKPGVQPVPKYVISADRLPTELQVVVLEWK